MLHNLPGTKPYKKFFGRQESLELIKTKLLNRIGHIASIDGVGGIGKTALTYHFCETVLIPQCQFDYLVWVSAKDTYFDAFDKENQIKKVENTFKVNPIEVLINETIKVVGFEEVFKNKMIEEKKLFFEEEILKNEKIFFVIDNLENIQGDDFFIYLDSFANSNNTKLKVLTTSRKREKVLTDNAIRIDEILEDDAVDMLRFLAESINPAQPVKLILNESRKQNAVLSNKANRIPIVLEFVVGQLSFGKSVGQIMQVLEGFPDINSVSTTDRDKVMSNIISFMFQYMYEDLSKEHQLIFKLISAFQRNKKNSEDDVTLDFLISVSGVSANRVKETIDDLMQNQLIIKGKGDDQYSVKQMAINFGKQFYDDYSQIEESVVEIKNNHSTKDISLIKDNQVSWILRITEQLVAERNYLEAESKVSNVIGDKPYSEDYRLYHKLANIQTAINQTNKAEDNYRKAINFIDSDKNVWYDWIDMEHKRNRTTFAIVQSKEALIKTNNEITIALQLLGMYKYLQKFDDFRKLVDSLIQLYNNVGDNESYIKLLRYWKQIEYSLLKDEKDVTNYFRAADLLLKKEDRETVISIRREQLRVVKTYLGKTNNRYSEIEKKLKKVEREEIYTIDSNIKYMNRMRSAGDYEKAKKEANRVLSILGKYNDSKSIENKIIALRVLFQTLSTEGEFKKIVDLYELHKKVAQSDQTALNVYSKAIKLVKFETLKSECQLNISKNRLPFVFQAIKEFCNTFAIEEKLKELIHLERRYVAIHSEKNQNLQDSESVSQEENKITMALLGLIADLI